MFFFLNWWKKIINESVTNRYLTMKLTVFKFYASAKKALICKRFIFIIIFNLLILNNLMMESNILMSFKIMYRARILLSRDMNISKRFFPKHHSLIKQNLY